MILGNPFARAGIFVLLLVTAYGIGTHLMYSDRIMPGVKVSGVNVGGKSTDEATRLLNKRAAGLTGLKFTAGSKAIEVKASDIRLAIDTKATAEAASKVGRSKDALRPYGTMIGRTVDVPLHYTFDERALGTILAEQAPATGESARNATIVLKGTDFEIVPEKSGRTVDPVANGLAARRAIERLEATVPLYVRDQTPSIKAQDLNITRAYARQLAGSPLTVRAGDRTFNPPPEEIASWITFEPREKDLTSGDLMKASMIPRIDRAVGISGDDPVFATSAKSLYAVANLNTIGEYVNTTAAEVDRPPENARLGFTNNQLVISGQPKDGLVVDRPGAVKVIADSLKQPERTAVLKTVNKKADIRQETLASLGLKTLIGTSTTMFEGSPPGRTYNIGVGAAKFNGQLIKPGQEFSFNEALGDVGPETGYVPELVILERTTEKQYGGGLCQVSTTAFRAAMAAGLPITARTNHSYAVRYYAPTGMDATIYPPYPDLKFKNNTPANILIQARQEGESVTFDFYGTADTRKASTEILYIRATEEAGGTAAFRYVVEGGPEPINRVFSSTYKAKSAFPTADSLN